MIILLVRYKCKPGCRERFYESIKKNGIDTSSQSEDGNVRYEYSFGIAVDELILAEVWRDEEAVELHKQRDHFIKLGELKTEYVEDTEILKYKAEQV